MENASKALIIAAALLLAILLISFGIIIIRQGGSIVNNSGMSEAELQMYNEKFLKYQGTQKGSVVKSLIQEANAANANTNNPKITLEGTAVSDGTTTACMKTENAYGDAGDKRDKYEVNPVLKSTDQFEVKCPLSANGRIETITINKK